MKFFVVLATLVLAINAATDIELWSEFKKNYGRDYKSLKEEQERFSVFQQSLRVIEEHNEKYTKGESTYFMGINQFTDQTPQEFQKMLNYSKTIKPTQRSGKLHQVSGVEVAASVNWVSKGVVIGVKDQGQCGSCWAFAAVGSIESQYAIKKGKLVSLSEQNLVDCSSSYGNAGCDGGVMDYGFMYVRDHGIETTADYPYTARDGSCRYSSSKSVLRLSSWTDIRAGDESALTDAIANAGPVAVAVNADNYQYYSGGIFDDSACSKSINHGVLAVGYGESSNVKYYLVKNSWGANWGEKGYIKMARNKNNQCGISSEASYAHVA